MPANKKKKTANKDLKMSSVDEADPRFQAISFDPRFARFPRREASKVKVDDRFASMFDADNDDFKVGASKDKRGRKHVKKKDDVGHLYRLDDDEEAGKDDSDEELDENTLRALRMRGLASDQSSDDSSSDDGSDESDADNELEEGVLDEDIDRLVEDWGVGAYAANPNEDVLMLEDSTARLACLDMDWENVKAVDILAVLRSFVPDGGRILSVTVYPSDYGLERMEEEKTAGPKQIYKKKVSSRENDGDGEGDDGGDGDDSDGALDESRLRYYERSKLRWYYAIVVCSNVKTAEAIYSECDGMEYMKTANVFDLRFVPEGQSFDDRKVRDTATELPNDYVAPVFQTKALQHTNVELTWDKVDGERKKTLSRKLNADDLKDEDFKTYLASASEDDGEDDDMVPDDDQDAVRARYQRLLAGGGAGIEQRRGKRDWGGIDDADDEECDEIGGGDAPSTLGAVADKDMELQVTFEQDLVALGEKLSNKAKEKKGGKGAETVWEAYERRRKEKRAEAKRKGKTNYHSSDDDFDSEIEQDEEQLPISPPKKGKDKDVDPFDDPFFASNDTFKDPSDVNAKKKKRKSRLGDDDVNEDARRARQNREAELEMLLMDDSLTRKRGNLIAPQHVENAAEAKKMNKKERMKLSKLKKRADREDGSDNEDLQAADGEYLDMKDPRFQDVFENPAFALDPTDPRFAKAGKGASKLATEAARRRSRSKKTTAAGSQDSEKEAKEKAEQGAASKDLKSDLNLKLMVANLKAKANSSKSAQRGQKDKNKV